MSVITAGTKSPTAGDGGSGWLNMNDSSGGLWQGDGGSSWLNMNDSSGRSSRMGIKDSITSVNPLSSCPSGRLGRIGISILHECYEDADC